MFSAYGNSAETLENRCGICGFDPGRGAGVAAGAGPGDSDHVIWPGAAGRSFHLGAAQPGLGEAEMAWRTNMTFALEASFDKALKRVRAA